MSDTLTLKTGEIIQKGDLIDIACRSYRFVEQLDGTSECVVEGESGVYMFLQNLPGQQAILVAEKEGTGTYYIYMGPDKISKFGLHLRKPEISLPRHRKMKGVKRKKKTVVEMAPMVVGTKVAPPKKKRQSKKDSGESVRKQVGVRKRGRPAGSKNKVKGKKR